MFFKTILLTTALVSQSLAAPQVQPPVDSNAEDWRLLHMRRTCAEDQSRCEYSFLIAEHAEQEPKHCGFAIDSRNGIPAYQIPFSLAKCPDAAEYSVNGGWNEAKFVTLSVINDERSLISFFGFSDEELANGAEAAPLQSKVHHHPMSVKREEQADDGAALALAPQWKLENVMRYTTQTGTSEEFIVVSFVIVGGDVPGQFCFLQNKAIDDTGAPSKSFYNKECEGAADWTVSWGHKEDKDTAVLTLVNKKHQKHAFFGFDNVSNRILLGENGPSPTKELPWGW